jgi:hypothetical protein
MSEATAFFLCTLLRAASIPLKEALLANVHTVVATRLQAASFSVRTPVAGLLNWSTRGVFHVVHRFSSL